MILWEQKLAFLAVPKTGTTAIQRALSPYAAIRYVNPPQVKHMNVRKYNRFMRKYLHSIGAEDIETMAVMREPISWLGSWYRYRQRDELAGDNNSTQNITFDQFVEAYLQDEDRPGFASLGSQATFLGAKSGEPGVDHLFTYENFRAIRKFLENRVGSRLEFSRVNVSPEMKLDLSAETEARLREKYAIDFNLYDLLLSDESRSES